MDSRNVQQAMLRFNEASKMPLMDPQAMAAPYEALGSVGRALTQTGSLGMTLAIKKQEATDKRLINTAQSAMDQAAIDFKAWQAQNPNAPESWTSEAQRRAQETLKPYLGMKEMSEAAKADLKLIGDVWQKQFVSGTDLAATKQTFGLAKQSYLNRANTAYIKGNRGEGDATLNEAVSGGYLALPEAEAHRMDGQVQATSVQLEQLRAESDRLLAMQDVNGARKLWQNAQVPTDITQPKFEAARKNALTDIQYRHAVGEDLRAVSFLADTDPTKGVTDLEDPWKFPNLNPAQRANELSKMRVAREAAAQDEVIAAKRAIDLLPADKIGSATVDGLGINLKQATPWHRAMIEDSIKAKQGKVNYEERFLVLSAAAGGFQSSGDMDKDMIAAARIELAAESLPTAYRDKVMQRLKDAQGGTGEAAITGPAIAEATRLAFEGNAFAEVNKPVQVDGVNVVRDPQKIGKTETETQSLFGIDLLWPDKGGAEVKENDGNPVVVKEVDPLAKAASKDKLEAAIKQLEKEAKMPKNKEWTPEDARQRMFQIMLENGATISPQDIDSQPTNPLLPAPGAREKAVNLEDKIKSYGY